MLYLLQKLGYQSLTLKKLNGEVGIYPPRLSAVRKHTPQFLYIIYTSAVNYASPRTYLPQFFVTDPQKSLFD